VRVDCKQAASRIGSFLRFSHAFTGGCESPSCAIKINTLPTNDHFNPTKTKQCRMNKLRLGSVNKLHLSAADSASVGRVQRDCKICHTSAPIATLVLGTAIAKPMLSILARKAFFWQAQQGSKHSSRHYNFIEQHLNLKHFLLKHNHEPNDPNRTTMLRTQVLADLRG
jgi:hypothetical protein